MNVDLGELLPQLRYRLDAAAGRSRTFLRPGFPERKDLTVVSRLRHFDAMVAPWGQGGAEALVVRLSGDIAIALFPERARDEDGDATGHGVEPVWSVDLYRNEFVVVEAGCLFQSEDFDEAWAYFVDLVEACAKAAWSAGTNHNPRAQ